MKTILKFSKNNYKIAVLCLGYVGIQLVVRSGKYCIALVHNTLKNMRIKKIQKLGNKYLLIFDVKSSFKKNNDYNIIQL